MFFSPSKTILLMEALRMDKGGLACIYTGTAVWHIHVQVYWYLPFITRRDMGLFAEYESK